MELSNTARHAKRELGILTTTVEDATLAPFVPELISLADKFGKVGLSGGSAPFTAMALAQAIEKLCLQEPICAITGVDDEWNDMSEYTGGEEIYQNNRCGALFKLGKEGQPYYLDAVIVKTQNGQTYSSNYGALCKDGSKIYSRQYIKAFPFKPKTFYIDVIEKEVAKDDFVFHIKDERQLKKVFNYYDRYNK